MIPVSHTPSSQPWRSEPRWIRVILIGSALLFLSLFLVLPVITVFRYAFSKGAQAYVEALARPDTWSAIKLTIAASLVAVPVNLICGLFAAWLLTKFRFRGRALLLTVIDLPLAVSPVVAGLILVLLFGAYGWLAPLIEWLGVPVIFAFPGIALATTFVTIPFVAREVIPLMEAQGTSEEEAALTLGSSGWRTFLRVTLPNIRWGVLYGVILCNARAMGEFGAVSVVSGHIRGLTNTLPLQIEILYNEYQFMPAFAAASLLTLVALLTLFIKSVLEWRINRRRASA